MKKQRHREETINTQLAIIISNLGVTAEAETILVHGQERPDVIFNLRGLRVVIEGKFADHPNVKYVVLSDARGRVQRGIAHIATAAIYPKELRTVPTSELNNHLQQAQITFCIVSETGETEWYDGTPSGIMDALRRAQVTLAQDNIVERTAKSLSERLEGVAQWWTGQEGTCDRLSQILGMLPPKGETPDNANERRETAAKVSALVIANALIFQEHLAVTDGRITPLRKLTDEKDIVGRTKEHWRWIWQNINYVPIFQLGENVLKELPLSQDTIAAFRALLKEANEICSRQSALRHDLMGRIYHWLLHYAKYLGTYYTSVSTATLLLKLVLSAPWKKDFGNPFELASFKIGDLACGTGTLLMASAQAVSDAFICARAESGRSLNPVDLQTLHRTIMENVIHGYDVLPSAVHLTASTLAMLAPEVAFVRMNLFVMPLGMDSGTPHLGSLDFLSGNKLRIQFALDDSQVETIQTSAGRSQNVTAEIPKLDLCVMNPPFVRSVGGNLLFGSLPDERGLLQAELKKRMKKIGASATAGLGSVFVALADKHLSNGGRLAFVLPAAVGSGESWGETRSLIATKYHLETVIASHDSEHQNFSENTELSEVLFIARKLEPGEVRGETTYVNLWCNPRSIHEALDLAARIVSKIPVSITGTGITPVRSARGKVAEMVKTASPTGQENWTGAMFAQTELLRTCWHLEHANLRVPGEKEVFNLPLCRLDELGTLGYDRRDIHDAYEVSFDEWSPFTAFWDHDAKKVLSISQSPNAHLMKRLTAATGRTLKDADQVWKKSGRILLVERVRTNTHRVLAIGLAENVLGNTWWAMCCNDLSSQQEKALLLWLNSTLSILLFFARRVITQGAWMQMKKPAWLAMPILDVRVLSTSQLDNLSVAYDHIAEKQLLALAKLNKDLRRCDIDAAICTALDLPDLRNIREFMAHEPGFTGVAITKSMPKLQESLFGEDTEEPQLSLF